MKEDDLYFFFEWLYFPEKGGRALDNQPCVNVLAEGGFLGFGQVDMEQAVL
jgi:hypothetical protein